MTIASYIDHTLLQPNIRKNQIEELCREALEHKFKAVCIPPFFVKDAARFLEESAVKVATVIGFPMGYSTTPAKVIEVQRAVDEGVDEIDFVINLCAVFDESWNYVKNDIESVTTAAHLKGKIVKAIIEAHLLDENQLKRVCELCVQSSVDFIKTSTGFLGAPPVTPALVNTIKKLIPESIKIKASGGIKDNSLANDLLQAGASRLGCSQSIKIISV
jgi:deoxyribose-phosphate aldolase